MSDDKPPLQTLETRLERIEWLIVDVQASVRAIDTGRNRCLHEIRERIDAQFAEMLQKLDVIRAKTQQ